LVELGDSELFQLLYKRTPFHNINILDSVIWGLDIEFSVRKNNEYFHPSKPFIERLTEAPHFIPV
jgi:hypothetical protein